MLKKTVKKGLKKRHAKKGLQKHETGRIMKYILKMIKQYIKGFEKRNYEKGF